MSKNEALKFLHTALIDAKKGYETAVKDADKPSMAALYRSMLALHTTAHSYVHAALTSQGEKADESGSFMGSINQAVVATRSAITGLDEGSLAAFASGEEHVVSRYEQAIKENADQAALAEELTRQKALLESKIAEMKRIAGSA